MPSETVPETTTTAGPATLPMEQEAPKRGRPSRATEFNTTLKDLRELAAIGRRMGGFDNVRAALELLEEQRAA